MTTLELLGNDITGEIPEEIGNLVGLTKLLLFHNELSGQIPESICNLALDFTSKSSLNMDDNYLCPPYPECLNPQVVGEQNFENCEYTVFCDDGFSEVNGFCYYQSDLDVLQEFIDNSQVGDSSSTWPQVPADLSPHELGLQLWDNGRLIEFCSSTWYAWCHSDYELRGEIPAGIGNLTNIVALGLHNNSLSGDIPPEIGNLMNLEYFSLSSNEISGEIPYEFGNLEQLKWLWLQANQLSGEIPESICNLTDLEWSSAWSNSGGLYSYIYGNQFCPEYPECIEEFVGSQDTSECMDEENCIEFHPGANLISVLALPSGGLSDIPNECIEGIIGEGVAATYVDGFGWLGSLSELSCLDGYWFKNSCENFDWCYDGIDCDDNAIYSLHMGSNLISYPFDECGEIAGVLAYDVQESIYAIAGEGVAALNTNNNWVGSLSSLCPNEGYWFVVYDDIQFSYIEPSSLARRVELNIPPYNYNQSTRQAFYFIESVENIETGDWILSFNGDKVIGAREWQGSIIDVPAMGDDGSGFTAGYIQIGQIPTFKLLKDGKLINLEGDISAFANNQLYMVTSLSGATALPKIFSLDRAYPNPFNPVTTLRFALPIEAQISLTVYNLQGREVISLVNGNMDAGYHSVVWNADSHSSGVYFVKMVTGDYINTQKLMLVK